MGRYKKFKSPNFDYLPVIIDADRLTVDLALREKKIPSWVLMQRTISAIVESEPDEFSKFIMHPDRDRPHTRGAFVGVVLPVSRKEAERSEDILYPYDLLEADRFPIPPFCKEGDVFSHGRYRVKIAGREGFTYLSPLKPNLKPHRDDLVFFRLTVKEIGSKAFEGQESPEQEPLEELVEDPVSLPYQHPMPGARKKFEKRMKTMGYEALDWDDINYGVRYTFSDFFITLYHNKKQQATSLVFDRGCPKAVVDSFKDLARTKSKVTSK